MPHRALVVLALLLGCTEPAPPAASRPPVVEPPARDETSAGARAAAYEPSESESALTAALAEVRNAPDASRSWGTLGAMFLRRHRETADPEHLRLADDAIDAALERDPRDTVALSMRGLMEMQAHDFRAAKETAEGILRVDRDDTSALLLLGDAELELGHYEPAVEAYQRAADLRPDLRVYSRGAYARWIHGDPEGAVELLALAIDAGSPRDPEATAWCFVDLALVRWHGGDVAGTRQALDQAFALVPDYLPARRLEARVLWAEGHHDEAITALIATLARQEQVGELLVLADWLELEGRTEERDARVARATLIRREDPRSLALYQARHGLESEAALTATRAELRRREDIYTHAAHAAALARAGRGAEARASLASALSLGTPDASLLLVEALVKHLGGDEEGARDAYARAAALNLAVDPYLATELARALDVHPGDAR